MYKSGSVDSPDTQLQYSSTDLGVMTPIPPLHLIYSLHIYTRYRGHSLDLQVDTWLLPQPNYRTSIAGLRERLTNLHYLEAALSGTFCSVQDKNVISSTY
jgi:hypothetical protein